MKRKYGFTMIEILMIALVMWTALIWVLAVMKKMEQSNTKITDNVIATNLAVQGYELFRAQENDIRYDSLLSIYTVSEANAALPFFSRAHWLIEWKYYVAFVKEKIYQNADHGINWETILDPWTDLELENNYISWETGQLRILLWAVCSGENFKIDEHGICWSWNITWDFKVSSGVTLWSGVCLENTGWVPCTWDTRFHREIIVSQDVARCGLGTGSSECEWTGENTIYRYRNGYNICSRVFYNWQAWWQSRKKQVAEICAKIN